MLKLTLISKLELYTVTLLFDEKGDKLLMYDC